MADDLTQYNGRYLECRDLRHAWVTIGYYRKDGNIARDLRCSRCTTIRTDVFGYKKVTSYDYPDEYHLEGTTPMDVVRQEVFQRAVFHDTEIDLRDTKRKQYSRGRR